MGRLSTKDVRREKMPLLLEHSQEKERWPKVSEDAKRPCLCRRTELRSESE